MHSPQQVGKQLGRALLGDPRSGTEAPGAEGEAGVIVDADDDHRHTGVAGPGAVGSQQPVVDDEHVGRAMPHVACEGIRAPDLGHEHDTGQRSQQLRNRRRPAPATSARSTRFGDAAGGGDIALPAVAVS